MREKTDMMVTITGVMCAPDQKNVRKGIDNRTPYDMAVQFVERRQNVPIVTLKNVPPSKEPWLKEIVGSAMCDAGFQIHTFGDTQAA